MDPRPPLSQWVEEELKDSKLGHKARHKRLLKVGGAMAACPQVSLPEQMGSWAELKGAYRFLANPQVSAEAILSGHTGATVQRCQQHERVLVIQDTTSQSFTHQVQDDGPLNQLPAVHGQCVHTALALSAAEHQVLGVLHQQVWARPPRRKKKKKKESASARKKRLRESLRWGEAVCAVSELFSEVPAPSRPEIVHVMDREADIFEVLEGLHTLGDNYVIRATRDRLLEAAPGSQPPQEGCYLFSRVEQAPVCSTQQQPVPARGGQPARVAQLEVRACTVSLMPPRNRGRQGAALEVNVVLAREVDPPPNVTALYWCLLTRLPIDTWEHIQEVLTIYEARWTIEEFHMGLKTGCQVEQRQLGTCHALTNFLALATVIACGMLALRDAARQQPSPPASQVLSQVQLDLLALLRPKLLLPPQPTAYEALRALASLGGFIGRKSDGEPGWRTLWRGWLKLLHAEVGYRLSLQRQAQAPLDSG